MFSIKVEDVFQITNRKGLVLIGLTSLSSGVINIGDILTDQQDKTGAYKIIGLEFLNYKNKEKNLTHNPAIIIDLNTYEHKNFIGKTFYSE